MSEIERFTAYVVAADDTLILVDDERGAAYHALGQHALNRDVETFRLRLTAARWDTVIGELRNDGVAVTDLRSGERVEGQ